MPRKLCIFLLLHMSNVTLHVLADISSDFILSIVVLNSCGSNLFWMCLRDTIVYLGSSSEMRFLKPSFSTMWSGQISVINILTMALVILDWAGLEALNFAFWNAATSLSRVCCVAEALLPSFFVKYSSYACLQVFLYKRPYSYYINPQ